MAALPASAQTPTAPVGPPPSQITAVVAQVTALFPKVEGNIISVEGTQTTLSIGKRDGVVSGVELEVYREAKSSSIRRPARCWAGRKMSWAG